MQYRHELKFQVSDIELTKIEYRLKSLMNRDANQADECYIIRSLYFDDYMDSCFEENMAGTDNRSKYRIRIYDGSDKLIKLEKKSKLRGMTKKESSTISKDTCLEYMSGAFVNNISFGDCNSELETELLALSRSKLMKPKCIVEYERSALTFPQGNVRITFDRNIRGSLKIDDFFLERIDALPVLETGNHILEVKYDEFLPDFLLQAVDINKLRRQSFSKYASVRMALDKR